MRRGNEPTCLEVDGRFVGFNLSADYCAEHEWGIKNLRRDFNIDPIIFKVAPSQKVLENLMFAVSESGNVALMIYREFFFKKETFPKDGDSDQVFMGYNMELRIYLPEKGKKKNLMPAWKPVSIGAAWGDSDFGLLVYGNDLVQKLRQVYEALKNSDAAIWLGGGGVFENAGLCIAIYSELPKTVTDGWKASYEDSQKLKKASEDTGIEKLLTDAGKRWFSLSPRWHKGSFKPIRLEGQSIQTKHPVIYWLNPMEQHLYAANWYTVEDLQLWAKDEGPVVMTQEQRAKRGR